MVANLQVKIDRRVDLAQVADFARRLETVTNELRDQILSPRPRKTPPVFTSAQVADMCGIERSRLNYLLNREGTSLPQGEVRGNRSRIFTLPEARQCVQQISDIEKSPLLVGKPGSAKILVVANFKGGSTKTTTAMNIAQGLSLLGRKCLLIDLDPQSSATELCGLYAEQDVREEHTILPFIYEGNVADLDAVIQTTYWDGLDLIPAHTALFSAEFHLPAMTSRDPGFRFWNVLRNGLDHLRDRYDYIVLDSAPSLSYMTINALMAADAMVMPLVPESLDFMSSVSFWSLFSDMGTTFVERGEQKTFDFISVLLSRVDRGAASAAPVVRSWAQRAYADWMHTIEVPASSVASTIGLALGTVHDLSKGDVDDRALARAKEPLTAYCQWIDEQYTDHWRASK
ncbi:MULTISPECIES: ParA family protein [unclassified Bordetella]|uniref:ParA family protein n=1 Tax=unclassified Bordetella TaxID=2630031 RepID=UPI00132AA8F0|nr:MULTISPECIES: AAA family ATPase [unclassified Bordetella]MVW72757.1 AAA family ATPase [Bordetella sp. 15P40C-2]MVW77678.1 AAA family ATPase [Bordetella sp. 02P26C-1]